MLTERSRVQQFLPDHTRGESPNVLFYEYLTNSPTVEEIETRREALQLVAQAVAERQV